MVKVKLDNGFECKVNEKKMKDVRFLKKLSKMDDGDGLGYLEIINDVLGDEQEEKLYNFLAKDDGDGGKYTDVEDVFAAVQEIFEKLTIDGENTGKNS